MKPDLLRVEAIFFEVISLPPEARADALRIACGDDDALRTEVESLLQHDDSSGTFLSGSALGPQIALAADAEPREDPKGARIGAYRVIRRIGTGGMGAVFLADRADGQFEQQVAIKVVKRGMDSEDILRRFEMERRTLATLNHTHIARLFDGGATPDGRPFLAMEYVDGEPIDEYCDARKLSVAHRLRLFSVVCDAVRFAHQNLVVHRDLKPSNIMVDKQGVPKLLDFGLAKVLVESSTIDPTISQERRLTPAYASPEQVAGRTLTTATDIYSLGVVLYELLTGRRPYRVMNGSPAEFERAVQEQEPVAPSLAVQRDESFVQMRRPTATPPTVESAAEVREGTVERLSRRLRGDLDRIVLKALSKDPLRRYESVEQFVADIERHLDGLPVLAQPDTALYRVNKFVRRHSVAVTLSAVTVVALTLGLGVAVWQGKVARGQREAAKAERDAAYVARDQAEATADFVQRMMSEADPMNQGPQTTVKEVLDQAAIRIDAELHNQPRVQAAIRSTIGRIYLGLGLYQQAEEHIIGAYRTRQAMLEPGHHDLAESEFDMARLLYEQGKFEQAEALLIDCLNTHELLRGKDNVDTARVWNDLGAVRRAAGNIEGAETSLLKALQIREASMGRRSLEVAETLNNLSGVVAARRDFAGAERLLTEALSIRKEILREEHPLVIQGIANIAVMVAQQQDLERAESLFREAIALTRRVLGDNHPTLAIELSSLAGVLVARGQVADAEAPLREAVEIRRQRLEPDDLRLLKSEADLARCLLALKKIDEGEKLALTTLGRRTSSGRPDDPFWKKLIDQLHAHYRATGDAGRAEEFRRMSAEWGEATPQP